MPAPRPARPTARARAPGGRAGSARSPSTGGAGTGAARPNALPVPARGDPDVELEVLCVVARGGPAEGLLDVHVPSRELAVRTLPEHPDRVHLARPLQHQHPVALPRAAAGPRVGLRPGRELEP